MSEFQSVNEGTNNKGKLQDIAVQCIKKYPTNQTLKVYAEYLSWDLKVTVRTALESYVIPMMRRGYFIHVRSDIYTQAQEYQPQNICKNCGKTTPEKTNFCSENCLKQFKQKIEGENNDAYSK